MPQFLDLVRQHILVFVANLTDFPAVKGFWKSVKIWPNYRHKLAHSEAYIHTTRWLKKK